MIYMNQQFQINSTKRTKPIHSPSLHEGEARLQNCKTTYAVIAIGIRNITESK